MDNALRLFSWYGVKTERVSASAIRSREDARKLGPFVDPSGQRLVLWRKPSFDAATWRRKRRSHFAHFPRGTSRAPVQFGKDDFDTDSYDRARQETPRHSRTRDLLVAALRDMVANKRAASWGFEDPRVSSFPLTGNLLEHVTDVVPEYPFSTPFGKTYKFDIALLGPTVAQRPILLAAVEIEFSHEFDILKSLLCKCLGFPLLSLDITETDDSEISEGWCQQMLLSTSAMHPEGRRFNFIYLHEMLYPVFLDVPLKAVHDDRHQYLVFARDDHFEQLLRRLRALKKKLGLPTQDNSVLIQPVNVTSDQARKMCENEGSIAGHNWRDFNEKRYIRVVLDRPRAKRGSVYLYHLLMARLLNGYSDALVGYKYASSVQNEQAEEPMWHVSYPPKGGHVPLLPKQVGQPVVSILAELASVTK